MPLDLNEAARCVAVMVVDAGVDAAVVEQQQRRLDAAHLGGEVERRVAVVVDTGRVWLPPVKFLKRHLFTFEVLNID